jgi:hypothetical protein
MQLRYSFKEEAKMYISQILTIGTIIGLCGILPLQAQETVPTELVVTNSVLDQDPDEVIAQIESSWQCDILGDPLYIDNALYDGRKKALCGEGRDGNIVAIPGDINYGLIDRLVAVEFPIDEWRETLADPKNLLRFQKEWEQPLHRLLMAATYDPSMEERQLDTRVATNYLRDDLMMIRKFIERRMSEAKASNRAEIARIWGEIIVKQFALYEANRLTTIPAPFRQEEPEAIDN